MTDPAIPRSCNRSASAVSYAGTAARASLVELPPHGSGKHQKMAKPLMGLQIIKDCILKEKICAVLSTARGEQICVSVVHIGANERSAMDSTLARGKVI